MAQVTGPYTGTMPDEVGELWAAAGQLDIHRPGPPGSFWVPRISVLVDLSILPRTEVETDAVQRYRDDYMNLPPIKVQTGTYKLIDGLHRLTAGNGTSDFILATEVDVSDDEIEDLAVAENRTHGLPLSPRDRSSAARGVFERHHPDHPTTGDAWTVEMVARFAGVSDRTVAKWLAAGRQQQPPPAEPPPRRGADGKLYSPRAPGGAAASAVKSAIERKEKREGAIVHATALTTFLDILHDLVNESVVAGEPMYTDITDAIAEMPVDIAEAVIEEARLHELVWGVIAARVAMRLPEGVM